MDGMMRKLRQRCAEVAPELWGLVVMLALVACYAVATLLFDYPWSLFSWHPGGWTEVMADVVVGSAHGVVFGAIAGHVENVLQLKLDLAADAEAMRGEIWRLERGER